MLYFLLRICFAQEYFYHREVIGLSETKRGIVLEQYGDGEDVTVVLSSIHGIEAAGTPLSIQFAQYLSLHPELLENRSVLLVHLTNPDGVVANVRGNRNNIDINRNFPTENFGYGIFNGDEPLSAIETKVLLHFFERYQPERYLVLHQPLNCIDYDGDSEKLAQHLSSVSGIRIKRLGSRSGSLGTNCS